MLDQGTEPRLALQEPKLGVLAVGDVADVNHHASYLIILAEILGVQLEPAEAPIAPAEPYLGPVSDRGVGPRAIQEGPGRSLVLGVHPRQR